MRFEIFSTVAEQITAHAAHEHPREACGLLVGSARSVEAAIPAANVADDPLNGFEIDPAALLRCHREARDGGLAVMGWYHSHPNDRRVPSAADATRADEDGRLWLIATRSGLYGFVTVPEGPIEGRFAAVDLILLSPEADG